MSINTTFKNAVLNREFIIVRDTLTNLMILDPTLSDFNEYLTYAEAHLPDLYDLQDQEVLKYDPSEWTTDYLDQQMATAIQNFSHERVDLLKKMCQKIYSGRIEEINHKKNQHQPKNQPSITKKQVGIGMMTGGTVLTGIGIATVQPVVTIAGAGIIIGGGIVYYLDK